VSDLYPFENHFLELNGLQYHYLDEGQGDPVVMVHGNPSWSFYYRDLAKALRDRYRVIAPDHIGCGLSEKPGDGGYSYTLKQRVDDLEALLEHLDIRNCDVALEVKSNLVSCRDLRTAACGQAVRNGGFITMVESRLSGTGGRVSGMTWEPRGMITITAWESSMPMKRFRWLWLIWTVGAHSQEP